MQSPVDQNHFHPRRNFSSLRKQKYSLTNKLSETLLPQAQWGTGPWTFSIIDLSALYLFATYLTGILFILGVRSMQYLNCSFKSLLLKLPFIVKYSVGKINVQSDYKDNKDYLVRLFIVRYGIIKITAATVKSPSSISFLMLSVYVNWFQANISFLYPQKILENPWFCDVFKGYRKGTLTWNR